MLVHVPFIFLYQCLSVFKFISEIEKKQIYFGLQPRFTIVPIVAIMTDENAGLYIYANFNKFEHGFVNDSMNDKVETGFLTSQYCTDSVGTNQIDIKHPIATFLGEPVNNVEAYAKTAEWWPCPVRW